MAPRRKRSGDRPNDHGSPQLIYYPRGLPEAAPAIFSYILSRHPRSFVGPKTASGCHGFVVTQCPDTAILGKVAEPSNARRASGEILPTNPWRGSMGAPVGAKRKKYHHTVHGEEGPRRRQSSASSSIPPKCKGPAPNALDALWRITTPWRA